MKKPTALQKNQYQKLVNDIVLIYEHSISQVNKILNKARWDVGRRIVEEEQNGLTRAPYGEDLIESLSQELTEKYGQGFSRTNLEYMRKFYMLHPKSQPVGKLDWSKWILLLSIEDDSLRRELHDRALKEGLTREALRTLILKENQSNIEEPKVNIDLLQISKYTLDDTRGKLYTYYLRAPRLKTPLYTGLDVDLGFIIYRPLDSMLVSRFKNKQIIYVTKKDGLYHFQSTTYSKKQTFVYKAYLERVIDGDTLLLCIDVGFGITTRQYIRLAGFNAPELDTKEGQFAKRYVEGLLKGIDFVIVKTFSADLHGRRIGNIYYLPKEPDPHKVAEKGIFLNEEIINGFNLNS